MSLSEGCGLVGAPLHTRLSSSLSAPGAHSNCESPSGPRLHELPPELPLSEAKAAEREPSCTLDGRAPVMYLSEVCGLVGAQLHERHPPCLGTDGALSRLRAEPRPLRLGAAHSAPPLEGAGGFTLRRCRAPTCAPATPQAPMTNPGRPAAAPPRPSTVATAEAGWRTNPRGFITPRRDALLLRRYTRAPVSLEAALAKMRLRRLPLASALTRTPTACTGRGTTTDLPWEAQCHGAAAGPSPHSGREPGPDHPMGGPNRFAPLCPGTSFSKATQGLLPRSGRPAQPACATPSGPESPARTAPARNPTMDAATLPHSAHPSPTVHAPPGHRGSPEHCLSACSPASPLPQLVPVGGAPPPRHPHLWLRCCSWHLTRAARLLRLHRALRRALGELRRSRLPTADRCRHLFAGFGAGDTADLLHLCAAGPAARADPGGWGRGPSRTPGDGALPSDWYRAPTRRSSAGPFLLARAQIARCRLAQAGDLLHDRPPHTDIEPHPPQDRSFLRLLRASSGATGSPVIDLTSAAATSASAPRAASAPLSLHRTTGTGTLPFPAGDPAALGPTQLWGGSPTPPGGRSSDPPISPTLPYDAQAGLERARLLHRRALADDPLRESLPEPSSPIHGSPAVDLAAPPSDSAPSDALPVPVPLPTQAAASDSPRATSPQGSSGPSPGRPPPPGPEAASPRRRAPQGHATEGPAAAHPDPLLGTMDLFARRLRCLRNSATVASTLLDTTRLGDLHAPLIWCSAVSAFSEQAESALRRSATGTRTFLGLASWWRRQGVLELRSAWQVLRGLSLWRGAEPPSQPFGDIDVAVQTDILGQAGVDGSLPLDLLHPTAAGHGARTSARPPPTDPPTDGPLGSAPIAARINSPAALGRLASWTAQLQDALPAATADGPSDAQLDDISASLVWLSTSAATLAACRLMLGEKGYGSLALTYLRRLWDSQAVRSYDDAQRLVVRLCPPQGGPPVDETRLGDTLPDTALALRLVDHIQLRPAIAADISADPAHFSRHRYLAGCVHPHDWEAATRAAASLVRVLPLLQHDPDVTERAGPWAVAGDAFIWIAASPLYRDSFARLLRRLACGEEGWRRLCAHMDQHGLDSPASLARALSQALPARGASPTAEVVAFQPLPPELQASVLVDAGLDDFSGGGQLRLDLAEASGVVERSASGTLRTLRALNEEPLRRDALLQAFNDTCAALRRAAQYRRPLSDADRAAHLDVLTTAAFWLTIAEQDASAAAACLARFATSGHHLRRAAMQWRLAGYSTPDAALRLLQEQVFWELADPGPPPAGSGVLNATGRWTAPLHPAAPWRTFDPLPRLDAARLEPWTARGSALLDDLLSTPVAPTTLGPAPGSPPPLVAGLLRSERSRQRPTDHRCRPEGDTSVSAEAANSLASKLRGMLQPDLADEAEETWLVEAVWLLLPCHARTVLLPLLVNLAIDATPFIALTGHLQDAGIGCPGDLQARLHAANPDTAPCAPYAALVPSDHTEGGASDPGGEGQRPGARTAPFAHADAVRSLLQGAGSWIEAKTAVARRGHVQISAVPVGGDVEPSDLCAICLQGRPPQAQGWPGCGHEFCPDCAAQWAALTPPLQAPACPICRTPARVAEDGSLGPVPAADLCRCSRCNAPIPDGRGPLCAYCRNSSPAAPLEETRPEQNNEEPARGASPRQDPPDQETANDGRPPTSRDAPDSLLPPTMLDPLYLADVARSVNHDSWAGGTALHTRLARAIIDHVGPGSVLVPSPADFLVDPALSDLHLPCFSTETEGYGQALVAARQFANDDTGLDDPPIVLMVNASGGQLQAILSRAEQMGLRAHIILMGSVQAEPCPHEGWQLATLAHKLWGHRAINALSHITPVGRPIRSRARGTRQFFLAATATLRPCTIDPPLTRISLCPSAAHTAGPLLVLAQESRRDDFDVELNRARCACLAAGVRLLVFTRSYFPSLEPGMQGEDVQPLTAYTIRWAGTCPAQAGTARNALQELRAFASREATPTHWITAVCAGDLPGAVIYPVGSSAMCTVSALWQKTAAQMGGRVVATAAGLGLVNVPPAIAQVCLDAYPCRDPALTAPMRLTGHIATISDDPPQPDQPNGGPLPPTRPLRLDFTLTQPTAGHDLLWLVATGGQHTAHDVSRAASECLGTAVAAAEERAWNPLSRAFEQMVLLTIPGHTRDAMERGPGAQRTLSVDGHALLLFPFTHFSPTPAPRSQRVDTPAENLRTTILRSSAAGAQPGARTTMVAPPVVRTPRGILLPDTPAARATAVRNGALTTHFMQCGKGAWLDASPVLEEGAIPASTTACFVGTQLDALLFPVPAHQLSAGAEPPALSPQHLDGLASQDWYPTDMYRRTWDSFGTDQAHAPASLSLMPGDFLVARAPAGATVELLGPTERLTATFPHPAWLIIRQPPRAALRAASHNLPGTTGVSIRHAVGVWLHCRRLPPAAGPAPHSTGRGHAPAPDGMDTVANTPPERARVPTPQSAGSLTSWRAFMARLEDRCRALQDPAPATAPAAIHLHPLALDAATCVMRHWRGPSVATPHLAAWLRAHVLALGNSSSPPLAWQWNLTCFAWAVHAAAADQPADMRAVQRLGGVMEISARQNPFAAWRTGRPGLPAGTAFPGARTHNSASRVRLGQCTCEVGPSADAALARLVGAALADAGGRTNPHPTPGPAPVANHPPTLVGDDQARPMEVDDRTTSDSTSRPPGLPGPALHTATRGNPPTAALDHSHPPAVDAPISSPAAGASQPSTMPAPAVAAQPSAHLPPSHAERRGDTAPPSTHQHPLSAASPSATAASQPASSPAAVEALPTVLDLTGLDAAAPPPAVCTSSPPAQAPPPPMQRVPRAGPPGRGAIGRGQTATAKASRRRSTKQPLDRLRRKAGETLAALPGPATARSRRPPATAPQRTPSARAPAPRTSKSRMRPPHGSSPAALSFRRGRPRDVTPSSPGPGASCASAPRRRRVEGPQDTTGLAPPPPAPHARDDSGPIGSTEERVDPSRHPVPALLDLLRAAGGTLAASCARSQLDARGYTGHYDAAVVFWQTTGFLSVEGSVECPSLRLVRDNLITCDSPVTPGHWYPLAPPPGYANAPPPQRGARRPLALLSLFDGTGMARVAIERALAQLGSSGPSFIASAFAELQANLASAVHALWAQHARDTNSPPHTCIAHDVWDLFRPRQGRTPLHDFARVLPFGTCVLLIAGPPCQDLTVASRASGTRGLCGDRSCHFYATPLAAWCLQAIRPDLIVHVVVENVSSMKPIFKREIARALNLPNLSHVTTLDSQAWCPFPRKRLFFSTLPPPTGRLTPQIRASPWDSGWAPRLGTTFHPMMQSRSPPGPQIQASTHNYHPKCLLYNDTSPHHWQGGDWRRVEHLIRHLLPDLLRGSFTALLTGPTRAREAEALPAAQWIEREGRSHGFRVPSAQERARAIGQHSYLTRLMQQHGSSFGDRDLFDWTGSHFDPDAVATCLVESLTNDAHQQPHEFLPPAALFDGYRAVLLQLPQHALLQEYPVPQDLLAAFQAATGTHSSAAHAPSLGFGQPPPPPFAQRAPPSRLPCAPAAP